jgi:hypothetical protein
LPRRGRHRQSRSCGQPDADAARQTCPARLGVASGSRRGPALARLGRRVYRDSVRILACNDSRARLQVESGYGRIGTFDAEHRLNQLQPHWRTCRCRHARRPMMADISGVMLVGVAAALSGVRRGNVARRLREHRSALRLSQDALHCGRATSHPSRKFSRSLSDCCGGRTPASSCSSATAIPWLAAMLSPCSLPNSLSRSQRRTLQRLRR